jgi:hypothetical protein
LRSDGSGAQAIPNDEQCVGHAENQSRDGVNFWRHAAPQPPPDFKWQGVVAADEEESDGDFIHGERENEQAGGDERELEIGKRDAPEGLPRRGAEIERGFLLRAIELLQAGKEFGGGHGDERGAVTKENGEQAELHSGENGKHEQREAGDDAGKNQREQNETAEKCLAGKIGAVERESGEHAERQGERYASGGDEQAVDHGIPDGGVREKLAVPVEREMARREAANAVAVEGIKNEHDNRQINEAEDQGDVSRKNGRALMCVGGSHL